MASLHYNHRGTAEQWIKEGKAAVRWTRLSCRGFAASAVGLQLHALAYSGRALTPTAGTEKTDRKDDADGIARLLRMGWFHPVHRGSSDAGRCARYWSGASCCKPSCRMASRTS